MALFQHVCLVLCPGKCPEILKLSCPEKIFYRAQACVHWFSALTLWLGWWQEGQPSKSHAYNPQGFGPLWATCGDPATPDPGGPSLTWPVVTQPNLTRGDPASPDLWGPSHTWPLRTQPNLTRGPSLTWPGVTQPHLTSEDPASPDPGTQPNLTSEDPA